MSKIAILTDTSANLPAETMAAYNIHTVPHNIQWGEQSFLDNVDITATEFYERLETDPLIPTTSQITMMTFLQAFEKLAETNDGILVPLISGGVSGTVDSARTAAAEFDKVPVEIVDTRSTAGGLALAVLAAGEALTAGKSLAEAAAVVRTVSDNLHVYFVVDTLKYLHRGGRIGGASRYLGTMLSIKPILMLNGTIDAVERVRGKKKALQRLVAIVAEKTQGEPVAVSVFHEKAAEKAVSVLEQAKAAMQVEQDYTFELSPVLGTHAGPGTVGIACYPVSCIR